MVSSQIVKIASSSVSQHTKLVCVYAYLFPYHRAMPFIFVVSFAELTEQLSYTLDKLTASSKINLEEMISRVFRSLVLRFILTQSTLSITVTPLAIDTNHNLSDPGVDMINAE